MATNNNHHSVHHIMPFSVYLKVAGALFLLTFLTIFAFQFREHLGVLAAPVAFLIAIVKASLVLMFFMHLKYDSPMNRLIFGTGFFFLAVLFVICVLDIWTRVSVVSTL